MIRRSLLAMFGAAPVAAVMPAEATPSVASIPPPSPWFYDNPYSDQDDDQLTRAKQRLEALQWAEKSGLSDYTVDPYAVIDVEANSMRSWSASQRERWRARRIEQIRRASLVREAMESVERQLKLSLAPSWMRRYL